MVLAKFSSQNSELLAKWGMDVIPRIGECVMLRAKIWRIVDVIWKSHGIVHIGVIECL